MEVIGCTEFKCIPLDETSQLMGQQQLNFFPEDHPGPTAQARMNYLNPELPGTPYYGFIGNRNAINKLIRIDFDALGKFNHACNELSLAFVGPASSGKTNLARRHARAIRLPMVEISPRSVKTLDDVFSKIKEVCADPHTYCDWVEEHNGIPLAPHGQINHFYLPPICIFFDEVHALRSNIVQGLLKATEHEDRLFVTESNRRVDCSNVHWMIGTTDRGKLFDAFDTRFVKIFLNLYTRHEISQIIKMNYEDWPREACQLVAHYCPRVPREALAFAREMELEYNMNPIAWQEIARRVAADNEIDEFGMTYKRLAILKALGQGPVAEKRLPIVAGVKAEELDKFTMPWLLASIQDQGPMVTVGTRGYYITEVGLEELDKRSIGHRGKQALAA